MKETMLIADGDALTKPVSSALLDDQAFLVGSDDPKRPSDGGCRRGILVVDDEPVLRDILRRYLQRQGFRVW